ncbi:response regulator [Spirochaeta dissipatitropha]
MNQRTILLADDDALVRDGLKVLIEQQTDLRVVSSVGDGRQALTQIRRLQPELALLDIRMPEMNGIDCCREAKQEFTELKVLILTTFHDDDFIRKAMQAGADGYLLKHQSRKVMIDGIRSVLAGNVVLEPSVARSLSNPPEKTADISSSALSAGITAREQEVLYFIAQGSSNREIADRLCLGEGTVRNYVSSLLEKLKLRGRTQLVIWYYQRQK